jgi:hypothetical protein
MSSPSWAGYLLAAVMIVTAVYCVRRPRACRGVRSSLMWTSSMS